jgi:hypothetical protein
MVTQQEINDISNDLCTKFIKSLDFEDDGNITEVEEDYDTDVEEIVDLDNLNKLELLEFIKKIIIERFTNHYFSELKTVDGNTQKVERNYVTFIENILIECNITYKKASSQKPKDFQNLNNTGLNIETKKTDGKIVICNDTCPDKDTEYLIICTKYKKILFINGHDISKQSPWLEEFKKELNTMKDKWCRGPNKKLLDGIVSTYIRPTYKFDISSYL